MRPVDAAALPWLALSAVLAASLYLLVVQGRILAEAIERPFFQCLVLVLAFALPVLLALLVSFVPLVPFVLSE